MTMLFGEGIERNSSVVGGEPVIKGTRVTLRSVLASLAEGASADAVLQDFPTLTEEDVQNVISLAAASALKTLPARKTRGS